MEKEELPEASSAQTFGILSIIFGCCCNIFGLPSIIFAYLGYSKASRAIEAYNQNPDEYISDSKAKTGKITAIIGFVLSGISIIGSLFYFSMILGTSSLEDNPELIQQIQQYVDDLLN